MSVLGVALVVGCSASVSMTKQLNTDKAEELIRSSLHERGDMTVEDVSCPEREVKQGDVAECTARVDGQPLRLQMTQDDDQGNVSILPVQAILDIDQAVDLVQREVGKAKGPVKADCGTQRFLIKDPGTTFDCRVTPTSGGAARSVVVTVKDVEGNVDLRLA